MVNNLVFEQDMEKEVRIRQIGGSLFENDNNGLRINVNVFRNGEEEQLSGTIQAHVIRSDGTLATVNGTSSGNVATVEIPSSCLMPGLVQISVKNNSGTTKTTVLALTGIVKMVNGSAFIDTGSVIPSLADYSALVTAAQAAADAVAQFSITETQISGTRYKLAVTTVS